MYDEFGVDKELKLQKELDDIKKPRKIDLYLGFALGGIAIFFLTNMLWLNGIFKIQYMYCQSKLDICTLEKKLYSYLDIKK